MSLLNYFTRYKEPVKPSESSPSEALKMSLARTRKILIFVNDYGYRFPLSNNERSKLVHDLDDLYGATTDFLPGERRDKIGAYVERNATSFGGKCPFVSHIEGLLDTL